MCSFIGKQPKRLRIEIKTGNAERGGVYGFDEKFSNGLTQPDLPQHDFAIIKHICETL